MYILDRLLVKLANIPAYLVSVYCQSLKVTLFGSALFFSLLNVDSTAYLPEFVACELTGYLFYWIVCNKDICCLGFSNLMTFFHQNLISSYSFM